MTSNRYRIWDSQLNEVTHLIADYMEIVGEHIIFYSNYDIRKTEMVMKLGPGWSVTRDDD